MIRFTLACATGHRFDSWFRDGAAFDDQAGRGLLACPICHSPRVTKAIMAPALVGTREPSREPASESIKDVALIDANWDAKSRALRALVRGMRDKLIADGQDVGRAFAAEARRIHDGEAPMRQIYGQASIGEARDLVEDGIAVLPMPIVPDELN